MTRTIEINGITFSGKGNLKEKMRYLAAKYEDHQIPDYEVEFMVDFLKKMHLHAQQKIGCGIDRIEVHRNDYGNFGFYIIRTDETETDFNWTRCIDCFDTNTGEPNREKYHASEVKSAFRHDIIDQTSNAKGGRGNPNKQTHHDWKSFDTIYKEFLLVNNLDPNDIELTGYEDGAEDKSLRDRSLADRWKKYHGEKSHLKPLTTKKHKQEHNKRTGRENKSIPPKKQQQKTLF